ncbi:hypothetical protein F5X68DRAFT_235698 [Plectosphaerella plurivora]|uniref:Uncharacterized protein n=1 Tax=Plectosphaerella plurivora TaxID=936078 RepID=A0A9P8V4M8_9PEZI|nr:hypothetical protein F5X68DRAFT_235698 [Plectosphaerella plurivora]
MVTLGYLEEVVTKFSFELYNTGILGPEHGCDKIRGHVVIPTKCPTCSKGFVQPSFFVCETPLIPLVEPPQFSTDWRPATLCEWFSSFFRDIRHPRGEAECCQYKMLCSAEPPKRHEESRACNLCCTSHVLKEESMLVRPAPAADFFPAPVIDFRVILDLLNPRQKPSRVKRIKSFMSSKLKKNRREESPPPPTRQNSLEWASEWRKEAAEKEAAEKLRKLTKQRRD